MSLDLHDITVEYRSGDDLLLILDGFTESFLTKQVTAVVGPSGSGKSTLLGVSGMLRRPTSGTVELDGTDVTSLSVRDGDRLRREHIGYVFQSGNLFPGLTVLDQVVAMGVIAGQRAARVRPRAAELLDEVGMSSHLKTRPEHLSGGQRQRVAIARAMIHRPALLLVDEPTAAVDRSQAGQIVELINRVTAEFGCVTVVATHDPEVVEAADRVVPLTGN
ncbi:ABC transporter ATP-binding protein [Gordonia sp. (in: high G+C Gram-positive bacteria)]|uniref:ABC transporter ATP-binding protein n=1 Tax=unclassified Gordonia (in: high G+C Gram-positive bacteria) TaxID=2657482 RepID=UPI00260E0B0A|nr:ABC transporter ATP-binding protein [Gordonia sp. (in: high G+C Gram-positive bacteria)]